MKTIRTIRKELFEHAIQNSRPGAKVTGKDGHQLSRRQLREDVSYIQNAAGISIDRSTNKISGVKLLGWKSRNSNRTYVPEGVDPTLYRNASVNINHPTEEEKKLPRPFVSRFGWIGDGTRGEEDPVKKEDGVYGTLYYNPRHPLVEAFLWWVQNKPDKVGLSHVAFGDVWEGAGGELVENLDEVRSVDVVTDSATTDGMFEGFAEFAETAWPINPKTGKPHDPESPSQLPDKEEPEEGGTLKSNTRPERRFGYEAPDKKKKIKEAESCWECGGSGVGPDGGECPECLGGHATKTPAEDKPHEQMNHPTPKQKPAVKEKMEAEKRLEEMSLSDWEDKHSLPIKVHSKTGGKYVHVPAGSDAHKDLGRLSDHKVSSYGAGVAWLSPHHESSAREPGPAPNLPYGYDEGLKEGGCTSKGTKIKSNMEDEYGKKKGDEVFFASANKGTIKGVKEGKPGAATRDAKAVKDYEAAETQRMKDFRQAKAENERDNPPKPKPVKEGDTMPIGLKDDKGKPMGTSQSTAHNPEAGGTPSKGAAMLEADDDEDLEPAPDDSEMTPGGDGSVDGEPGGEPTPPAGPGDMETEPEPGEQVAGNDGALDLSDEMLSAITKVVTSTLSNQDKRKRVGMILKGLLHDTVQEGTIPKSLKGAKKLLREGVIVNPHAVRMVLQRLDAFETREDMAARTSKAIELCEGLGLPASYRSDYFIECLAECKDESKQKAMIEDRKLTYTRAHMKPRSALGDPMLLEGEVPKNKKSKPKTEEEAKKQYEESYQEFEQEALGIAGGK